MKKRLFLLSIVLILFFTRISWSDFGGAGNFGSVIEYLKRVGTNINPTVDATYSLGNNPNRWASISTISLYASYVNIVAYQSASSVTVTSQATVTSNNTSEFGWNPVQATNQACNTSCTFACVIGMDTATTKFVRCNDATADSCLCAGAN